MKRTTNKTLPLKKMNRPYTSNPIWNDLLDTIEENLTAADLLDFIDRQLHRTETHAHTPEEEIRLLEGTLRTVRGALKGLAKQEASK